MLKELGYDGVGHIWLDKVDEHLKSVDAVGLKLYQITMTVDVATAKNWPTTRDSGCAGEYSKAGACSFASL